MKQATSLCCQRHRLPRLLPLRRSCAAVAVAALLAATSSCSRGESSAGRSVAPVPVRVGKVERRTVPVTFRAIGTVEPLETVAVKSRVGGELVQVLFREGEMVRAGAPLAVIDRRPYAAALAQAEAVLARDQALLEKAEADVARYATLVAKDFVTKESYDQMVANVAALRATVAADRAAVDLARLNLEYCTISAPISGRTGALTVKVGSLVKANDDRPLVTIHRTQPIQVSFAVPAQYLEPVLARRASGIKVLAALAEGEGAREEGSLTFVDNAVDVATNTVLLKGTFANQNERLWPGQFVQVTVVLGEEPDRVVCPAAAVQTGQSGQYVFVVQGGNTVEVRPVVVARADEQEAVVAQGLEGGETVVTDGQLRLAPGVKVEVKPAGGESRP